MFPINAAKIRQLMFEHGLTLTAFAEQSKVHVLTIRKMLTDGAKCTAKPLMAVAKLFGIDAEQLLLKEMIV